MTTSPNNNPATAATSPDGLAAAALEVAGIRHKYVEAGSSRFARHQEWMTVLADISFTVPSGTMTAIVGPSGCGKSTLLRILAGLENAHAGSATIGGRSLIQHPGSAAYHPQEDALLPWATVLDNATLGAEVAGVDKTAAQAQARELLRRFGLAGFAHAWPDELSGGMRQRVALLRSTLMPQPVLLLDEPLGALDALTRRQLQLWLLDITAADKRPSVLVTHDIDEALLLADEVIVLSPMPARIVHTELRPDTDQRRFEWENGVAHEASRRILGALEAASETMMMFP